MRWCNDGDPRVDVGQFGPVFKGEVREVEREPVALDEGQVRVTIDKFALTSNNVSYAVSGDEIGYWQFFPCAEEPWGKVTVWGMADVVESRSADIPVGERIYGFFPMSTELVMSPGRVKDNGFVDMAPHRQSLPGLYNYYARTHAEPAPLRAIENERCVFFPLFITSFVIADFLLDNGWFSAEQVVIGSVSSKTGFGLARFVRSLGFEGKVVGLTSEHNRAFVDSLALCDQVLGYDEVERLDQVATAFVDMAGDAPVRMRLHQHLGELLKTSQVVGVTHWDSERIKATLPGAKPVFFFAPAQIEKRNREWGGGALVQRGSEASAALAIELQGLLKAEYYRGVDACASIWRDMLDNKISGQRSIMVSLQPE